MFSVTLTIRKLEQEILAAGHHVCILTTVSGDPDNTHLDGTHPNRRVLFIDNSVPIPFVNDPNHPDHTYQLGFALSSTVKAELDDFEPTIIHVTCPDCTCLHVIEYARHKEIPLMGTYHSNIAEYVDHYPGLGWAKIILGSFFRHQYNFLQALYAPTPYIVKHLSDNWGMDAVTNLGIWGRGVDIDKFNPCHASLKYRHRLGIPDDCVVVCWVGRLVKEKSVDIFSNVIRRLHAEGIRNFRALVIGAGPHEDEIKTLPNTTFAGWMTPEQLMVAYASCDVFLFPSSVETFGNVTLEAASSGLPVVVEAGCSGHLVKNGVNGFGCQEGDENAFYEATRELIVNEKLRKTFSIASRRMAESLEKRTVVRGMLDNYRHVTEEFYTEYGGHHANRDRVYRNPGSFVAGNHPRPTILVIIEYLFIVLFQVIWNMTSIYYSMQNFLTSFGVPGVANLTTVPPYSSEENDSAAATSSVTLSSSSAASSSRRQLPAEDVIVTQSDGPAIVELDDIEIGRDALLLSNSLSEDETDADDSSSSQEETSTSTSPPASSCGSVAQSVANGCDSVSKALSLSFIRTVECQCRVESHLRNAVGACCSPAVRRVKRKNSCESLEPEILVRARSSPERLTSVEGHRLRRQYPLESSNIV